MIEFNSGELGSQFSLENLGSSDRGSRGKSVLYGYSLASATIWFGSRMSTARLSEGGSEANRLGRRDVKISLAEPY
jgi:hypothetical protein